jgi:hypothetical protein
MTIQEHIEGLVAAAGLKPEDVAGIKIDGTTVTYTVYARDDDGELAVIESSIGSLPLKFDVVAMWRGEPDHEHGPDTHTHD